MNKAVAIFTECLCGLAAFTLSFHTYAMMPEAPFVAGVLATVGFLVGIGAFVAAALIGSD